jgi:putative restriction endonuclease
VLSGLTWLLPPGPPKSELINSHVLAGFSDDVFDELVKHPTTINNTARVMLEAHFPETIQRDLADALQLDLDNAGRTRTAREPKFRADVLRAYNYRCAICGYEVRLGNQLIGVEAAHIRWVQANGPDAVVNGIALCTMHHKLFDRGAFSIETAARRVICSKELIDRGSTLWLSRFHGQPIAGPSDHEEMPQEQYLQWHFREVFRSPAVPL